MLHVLLLILKIIGWILLGIIGLLLLLVILILFCPIRYQADISYQGGKTLQAKAKVRYLILSVRVLYDQSREKDKLKQEIRLLWFRIGKKKAEEAEREVEHHADEGFDDAWDDIDVDSDMDVYDIVYKVLSESTINESFDWDTVVEPLELSKTIKEINSRMNLSNIIDITSNHNSIFVNTDPFTYTIHLNKKYLWIEKSDITVYKQKLDNGKVTKSDLVDVLSFINTDVRDMKRNVEESTIN